jgi:hypothetical protein
MRIDYIHSGNAEEEHYKLDEILKEPHWGGSKVNLIDHFDYGNYKFHVYDPASENLIYSYGYSTLFREWQATDEAKEKSKSFMESITFPYPKKTVNIEFYSRNKNLDWEKQFELTVDPGKAHINKQKRLKYKKIKVHKSGNPNQKLDIVIIPEGYTKEEMDKFKTDNKLLSGYLLEADPYNKNRDKINFWAVIAPSEESGTDIPGENIWKNTITNTSFYTFGSERYLTSEDMKSIRDLASNAPYDQILILVNQKKYGGGGIYNFYSVCTSDNESTDFLFLHEFGHAFAGLADEYYTSDVAVEDFYPLDKEPWEPNITTLVNFEDKWKNMMGENTSIPTPVTEQYKNTIGVFEGGGYVAKGVYRPFQDCTMKSVKYDNFCPVCKRAIQRMIDYYSK